MKINEIYQQIKCKNENDSTQFSEQKRRIKYIVSNKIGEKKTKKIFFEKIKLLVRFSFYRIQCEVCWNYQNGFHVDGGGVGGKMLGESNGRLSNGNGLGEYEPNNDKLVFDVCDDVDDDGDGSIIVGNSPC